MTFLQKMEKVQPWNEIKKKSILVLWTIRFLISAALTVICVLSVVG